MSSFDAHSCLRTARTLVVVSFGFALAGCFQPMYGGGKVQSELSAVKVLPIPDRLGHYLENELVFGFGGGNTPAAPRYSLTVQVSETTQTPLIDTTSGRATAGTVVTRATYKLTSASDGRLVAEGTAVTAASYDRTGQRFADVRANRDAEIRDAKSLADQIQTRVAVALGQQ